MKTIFNLSYNLKNSYIDRLLSTIFLVAILSPLFSQNIILENSPPEYIIDIDIDQMRLKLLEAPMERTQAAKSTPLIISIPWISGEIILEVWESPIMDKEFQKTRPDIKTYGCRDIHNPHNRGRLAISDFGLSGVLLSGGKMTTINPANMNDPVQHKIKKGGDLDGFPICGVNDDDPDFYGPGHNKNQKFFQGSFSNGTTLRTYNLAICATGEFHDANGGSVAAATTVITNSVNGIQAMYEVDLAVRFNLLTPVVYTDYNTDPYTPGGLSRTDLSANVVDMNFTQGQYDIGHTFHDSNQTPAVFSGGGVAYLGAVCDNGSIGTGGYYKAGGWSGSSNNATNSWYQLATHEFGHMFDATHTFNGEGGSCTAGSHPDDTAYEIGSGTTIMSYQGLCQSDNNIAASGTLDNYFHTNSLDRMIAYMVASGTCAATTTPGNTPPTVNASGGSYTIPVNTPFSLTATSSDPQGDAVTYCWEQYDEDGVGVTTTHGFIGPTAGASSIAPLFRSFPPTTEATRNFPESSVLLNNANVATFEPLPSVGRTLNFRVTARDNNVTNGNGGIACDDIAVTVHDNGAPFQVTSQNSPASWVANGSNTATVTWDVASTTGSPISCANVDILFSVDGGQSFPHILASATANDGTESITIPSLPTCAGRLKIVCSTSIFFDINDADIDISSSCTANGATVSPSTSVSAPAGDPSLDLSLSPDYGTTTTSTSVVLNSGSPRMALTFSDGGTCSAPYSNNPVYGTFEFYVSESDDYTFTNNGSPHPYVFNLYINSFDDNNTCTNWLNSTASCCVSTNPSMTSTLCPGIKYILVMSAFSTSNPGGTYTCDFTSAGSGIVLSAGTQDPGGSYSYTYAIVDNGTNEISDFDPSSDLSNSSNYPGGNTYTVYGLSYLSSENLAPYVGGTFTNFQNDLLNLNICGNLSSNTVSVMVTMLLPIELVEFQAKKVDNGKVNLTWKTASERNNKLFVVEKSDNGYDFNYLAELAGAGTINTTQDYQLWDENPFDGINYYRLKQFDFDGNFTYSETRTVHFDKAKPIINIFPNPAKGILNIQLSDPYEEGRYQILDLTGKILMNGFLKNSQLLDTQALPRAVYFLKIRYANNVFVERVILQ